MNIKLKQRFWSKVDSNVPNPLLNCWKWKGSHFSQCYPMFHINRVPVQATRVMLKMKLGKIKGMALHTCDNRWCINPNHLYDGTQKQNMADRMERGIYHTRFTGHKRAKLIGERFKSFKSRVLAGEPPYQIAKEYGIHGATACKIAKKLFTK